MPIPVPIPTPEEATSYLDFFIKGGGWAALLLFILIARFVWNKLDTKEEKVRLERIAQNAATAKAFSDASKNECEEKESEISDIREGYKLAIKDYKDTLVEKDKLLEKMRLENMDQGEKRVELLKDFNVAVGGVTAKLESTDRRMENQEKLMGDILRELRNNKGKG